MNKKQVAILFSGGVDSTSVAIHYLKKGYFVHLLTFNNGAARFFHLPESKAWLIRERYADQCCWQLLNCVDLFHELSIKTLEKDVKRFGNLVCCGCKLAMLAETIVYCRKNGIVEIADGFQKEQYYYPEQTPQYMLPADELAGKYGISYQHPIYEATDWSQQDIALNASIPTSGMQTSCLFGHNPIEPTERIREYVEEKIPIVLRYIEQKLMEKRSGVNNG